MTSLLPPSFIDEILAIRTEDIPPFDPLPHQAPPETDDWWFWLLEAGRGTGKTSAAAHYMQDHLNGPPCISKALPHRALLIAPTIGDGIESADLNDQALTRLEPGAHLRQTGGGTRVVWPNKSQVRVVGTHSPDDIDRLRAAGNNCLIWAEELASWRKLKDAWEIMLPGLRVGPNPRVIATTTPKRRPDYITIRDQASVIAHATTLDNPHLNDEMRRRLFDLYGSTTIGEQELYGRLIEEAEGALWTQAGIDADRFHPDTVLALARIVVGVDPSGGVTETGTVAAGLLPSCRCGNGPLPHFAVLEDVSATGSPRTWANRAVSLLDEYGGDRIVAEKNFGGDMVEDTIRNVAPNAPVQMVTASRGKRVRAEPIQALYEQHRVHHIGTLPLLEAEMVQWVPDEADWSPNRIDALVWAMTDLAKIKMRKRGGWTVDPDLFK